MSRNGICHTELYQWTIMKCSYEPAFHFVIVSLHKCLVIRYLFSFGFLKVIGLFIVAFVYLRTFHLFVCISEKYDGARERFFVYSTERMKRLRNKTVLYRYMVVCGKCANDSELT